MVKNLWCLILMVMFILVPVVSGAKSCPKVTVENSMGVPAGAFPRQYDVAEFESLADCKMTYSENPNIAELNSKLNPGSALPSVEECLPVDALVFPPYFETGKYGGRLTGLSKSPESGTSDFLSVRHANLFRFDEDLKTVVPYVAKAWKYNDDYTELTVTLRKGHKWSDGHPFTAEDIAFWFNDIKLNKELYKNVEDVLVFGKQPMQVTAVDETTVLFKFAVPSPNVVIFFASEYRHPFQPKHILSKYLPKYNQDADANAKKLGFESWKDLFRLYYSDWKDSYHPFSGPEGTELVIPTLESHVLVEETSEFRRFLANSYFFIVDSAGNQLPYIDEHYEIYSEDNEVTILKMINGEIDYKQQGINLAHFPTLKENEEGHSYRVMLKPAPGEENYITFNITHQDQAKAKIFGDVRFRQAMSLAINRDEINEIVYLGQGRPMQALPANFATTDFVDEAWLKAYTEYDPEQANALLDEMGLTKRDSEGFRLRFDGEPLVVLFYYAPQCGPAELFELVKGYWDKVGVRTELKELTSDVYRERTSSNKHDIATWGNGYSVGSLIAGNPQVFYPPFGNPIDQRTGIAWAEWKRTNGAGGLEPPEDIKRLFDLADRFKKFPLGSQESNRVGAEMVKIHADNLLGIGTVGDTPDPIFVNNRVGNFGDPPAKYYGAYWIYPMRPAQWYIKK